MRPWKKASNSKMFFFRLWQFIYEYLFVYKMNFARNFFAASVIFSFSSLEIINPSLIFGFVFRIFWIALIPIERHRIAVLTSVVNYVLTPGAQIHKTDQVRNSDTTRKKNSHLIQISGGDILKVPSIAMTSHSFKTSKFSRVPKITNLFSLSDSSLCSALSYSNFFLFLPVVTALSSNINSAKVFGFMFTLPRFCMRPTVCRILLNVSSAATVWSSEAPHASVTNSRAFALSVLAFAFAFNVCKTAATFADLASVHANASDFL